MKSSRTQLLLLFLLPALPLLLILAAKCVKEGAPPPPFEGAQALELASAQPGRTPTPAEIEQLVARMLVVAGGSERLRHANWKRTEDLYLSHSANPLSNRLVATTSVRSDHSLKMLLEYGDGTNEQRVMFQGEEYLQPNSMNAAPGELHLAVGAAQQYVEWDWEVARLPVILAEAASLTPLPSKLSSNAGTGAAPGSALIGVKVDVADLNPKFEAWIDPSGPMIVEVVADMPVTADLAMRAHAIHVQRFSDFRRVGGLLFPFRRELFVDDRRFGLAEARSIEIDVELPDESFVPK